MLDEIFKSEESYIEFLSNVGIFAISKDDNNKFLSGQLAIWNDNRKKAEGDVVKYSVRILIALFIFLLLLNTKADSINIGGLQVSDVSLIATYFPVVILYLTLLMLSADLYRVQSTLLHYSIQGLLFPDTIMKNIAALTVPYSFIGVLATASYNNRYINKLHTLSFRLLFFILSVAGIATYIRSIYYGFENGWHHQGFLLISLALQTIIVVLLVSVMLSKIRLMRTFGKTASM